MKRSKKLILVAAIVAIVGFASIAYGASGDRAPADIVSSLTGKSMDELYRERAEGKTFGEIAREAGKLDEFKGEMLKEKKVILDKRVEDGQLTQEQADAIYNRVKENQANCDGTGRQGLGRNNGQGFGLGRGKGMNRGMGLGCGMGYGRDINR